MRRMEEPELVEHTKKAWMAWKDAMNQGTVVDWVDENCTPDISFADHCRPGRPSTVVGKEGICRYYNKMLDKIWGEGCSMNWTALAFRLANKPRTVVADYVISVTSGGRAWSQRYLHQYTFTEGGLVSEVTFLPDSPSVAALGLLLPRKCETPGEGPRSPVGIGTTPEPSEVCETLRESEPPRLLVESQCDAAGEAGAASRGEGSGGSGIPSLLGSLGAGGLAAAASSGLYDHLNNAASGAPAVPFGSPVDPLTLLPSSWWTPCFQPFSDVHNPPPGAGDTMPPPLLGLHPLDRDRCPANVHGPVSPPPGPASIREAGRFSDDVEFIRRGWGSWQRAMENGTVGEWVNEACTEDIRLWDHYRTCERPVAVGKSQSCSYYNKLLQSVWGEGCSVTWKPDSFEPTRDGRGVVGIYDITVVSPGTGRSTSRQKYTYRLTPERLIYEVIISPVSGAVETHSPPPQATSDDASVADGEQPPTPPCKHNSWDNVRIKRGWLILRCRVCQLQWRLRPLNAKRCPGFAPREGIPPGCPKGVNCELLHIHYVKHTKEQRHEVRRQLEERGVVNEEEEKAPAVVSAVSTIALRKAAEQEAQEDGTSEEPASRGQASHDGSSQDRASQQACEEPTSD
eukprot:Hpha_TRINITY_DN14104_c0_g1::TRINITY_DN14104_c0_g1_i1::g.10566::m.10566